MRVYVNMNYFHPDKVEDIQVYKWSYESSTKTLTVDSDVSDAEISECDGWDKFTETEKNAITCRTNKGSTPEITIDDSSVEKVVFKGGEDGYFSHIDSEISGSSIDEVDIQGTGITAIDGGNLFYQCPNLKTLDLGKTSITTISDGPFSGSYLESITLPKGLTTLGTNALADCGQKQGEGTYGDAEKGIKSIVIPSTVTSIGQNAFSNLLGLKVVYLPVGITSFNISQDTTASEASADHSEPTFSKEYVVYDSESTDDPAWVTKLKNAWAKNTAMHKETFSYPSGIVAQIEAAAAVTSAKDMTTDIAKGLLSARVAYATLSDLAKAAPGLENVDWDALYAKSDAAMKVLGEALVSGSGIDDAQMNAVAATVAEYCNAQAQKELDAYKAQAQKQYDELKAQTAQQCAEWQDEAASLKVKGASKAVKVKKAKKTKKAAKVKLKLANSASGTVATVAKAKGGSKFITVGADGKVVLKKGVKKGTYKAKVTVTYGKHSATVTVKFTVK